MMDTPFTRIVEGLNHTLENVVAPEIASPIVRGQLFAVVEILNQIQGRFDYRHDLMIQDIQVGRQMLEKLGYAVITAASGQEALEIYPANKDDIELVILDIVMPGLSAADLYEQLKAVNPQVKVLLSSGYGMDQQTNEILNRGCDGFIQKPFNMQVTRQSQE